MTPEAQVIEAMFHILPKDGPEVPFHLNPSQSDYDSQRTPRDLIPKARQKGFSSLGIGYQCVDCLTKEGTRAVLISHEGSATQRLLDRASYYIRHLEGPAAALGRHSRNEFFFPKTESTLYIGTAGAKAFGRGDTITHLHISEYAWWETDALRHVAGLFQAVPASGTVRIESTGNGRNNDFHYMCMHAQDLGYQVYFRSWHADDEYSKEPTGEWCPEGFEHYFQDMKLKYNLSEAQLYWYWLKLLEFRMDLKFMQQEYPSALEECFQATGGAVFESVTRVEVKHWDWKMWDHKYRYESLNSTPEAQQPDPRCSYVIGADAAGGTGNDDAAIVILCLETWEQVFEMSSNRIDPVEFGWILAKLGEQWNQAWIVAEGNNHGIATHSILTKNYDRMKLYKRHIPTGKTVKIKYGFHTGESTKHELIGAIAEAQEHGLILHGLKTTEELKDFEEFIPLSQRDKPNAKTVMGAKEDGLVIALGLACVGMFKYRRFMNPNFHDRVEIAVMSEREKMRERMREASKKNFMNYTFDELFERRERKDLVYGRPRMVH